MEGRNERQPRDSDWIRGATYQLPMLVGFDINNWLLSLGAEPSGRGEILRQVSEGLDQLQNLGFNNLYLTGIFLKSQDRRIKGVGTPFCISDHTAIDPQWGTIEDLKFLIQEAHRRNMQVVVDLVLNHTAWDHPWVKQHPEFYIREGREIVPGGCTLVDRQGEHLLPLTDVAQLDHSNPQVREALGEIVEELVDWGIDGFRVDMAAQMVNKQIKNRWGIPMPGREWLADIIERARRKNRSVAFLGETHGEEAPRKLSQIGFDVGTSKADDEAGEQVGWYDSLVSRDPKSITAAIVSCLKARRTDTAAPVVFVGNHDSAAPQRILEGWLKGATALSVFLRPLLWVGATEGGFDYDGDRSQLDPLEKPKFMPLDARYSINFSANPSLLAWHKELFRFMAQTFRELGDNLVYQVMEDAKNEGWVGYELRSTSRPGRVTYKIIANPNQHSVSSPFGELPAGACWLVNMNLKQIIKLTDL